LLRKVYIIIYCLVIIFDINGDIMPIPSFKHWMRHLAAVPKGFLRYQVLELLSEKPLSGSEIMDEIEKRTDGLWRPSPGSVYPLLAWLQDNGYIRESPNGEGGIKRYMLTDSGRQLLEEQRKMRSNSRCGRKFFAPPLLGTLWLRIPAQKIGELRKASVRLLKIFLDLSIGLEEKFSEEALDEIIKVLNETAEQLERINKKIWGEEQNG